MRKILSIFQRNDYALLILSLIIFFGFTLFHYFIWYCAGHIFFQIGIDPFKFFLAETVLLLGLTLVIAGMVLIKLTYLIANIYKKRTAYLLKDFFVLTFVICSYLLGCLLLPAAKTPYLKGLKKSIEKRKVDLAEIQNWLNITQIEQGTVADITMQTKREPNFPDEISSLNPDFIVIDKSTLGKTYLRLTYGGPVMHYGVVVGVCTKEIQIGEEKYRLDFAPNAFVWIN